MDKHKKINKLLVDFALGELSQRQENEVKTHQAECRQCNSEVRRLEALLECTENIRQVSADEQMCESAKQAVLQRVESQEMKQQTSRPNVSLVFIWRTIMKSKIAKFAAAAVIIIAVILILHNGSIDMATITFADISEAMKNVPWMHSVSRGYMRGINLSIEEWIGFEAKIRAAKQADGKVTFWNTKEHKHYTYDPENRSITIDYVYDVYAHEDDFPFGLSCPDSFLENMNKRLREQGAHVTTKEVEYNGQKAQLQEISLSVEQNNESLVGRLSLYIQPDSKLLLAAQAIGTDSKGNIIGEGETTYSYPQAGPADIYDLGVPRDAKIISNLPKEDYQAIWESYRQKRAEATKSYIAVITHINHSLGDVITMVDIDYKSNQNHRLERHFIFNTGQVINKFWPEYKEQLGDSFESLLA